MISKKYKEVMKNLENNLNNKRDLEYAKNQISDLTTLYIDELAKVVKDFEKKIEKIENKVSDLELDILKNEGKDNEFEEDMLDLESIICPYCENKFWIEYDLEQKEIKCPKCQNLIELEWDEDDM